MIVTARSGATQQSSLDRRKMDCFAALAMTNSPPAMTKET
jgi:hypothetical protein